MSKDLFKEAIADAKTVREAALANAKLALEEAFTPHIKEMLAAKIQEMEESENLEEVENIDEVDGEKVTEAEDQVNEDYYEESGNVSEELSLEEILAELEKAEKSEMEEAKRKKKKDKANSDPTSQSQEDTAYQINTGDNGLDEVIDLEALLAEAEEEEAEESGEEATEEEEVGEMTVEELKDLIRSIVGEMGGSAEAEMPADEESSEEMTVDLDEIIAEAEDLEEAKEELEESPVMDIASTLWDSAAHFINQLTTNGTDTLNASELVGGSLGVLGLLGLSGGGSVAKDAVKSLFKKKKKVTADDVKTALEQTADKKSQPTAESVSEVADETLAEIEALRTELNETNLLNAKLLYSSKILRANELTESQKLRVINAFDKAANVSEAKLIYETIKDSFNTAKEKKQIKESLGFASKPTGAAPKSQIVAQPDSTVARLQKLAGII